MTMRAIGFVLCGMLATSAAMAAEVTVVTAAKVHTMDTARPHAQAFAFDDSGAIVAVGNRDELLSRYPEATRIDAGDATVVPGLIDAHGHVSGLGLALLQVDLVGTRSRDEVLQRLRDFAREL